MPITRMIDAPGSEPAPARLDTPDDGVSVGDEAALVERARQDRRAFAPLYLSHYPAIVAHIHRRVGDSHASQDIAAETFIRAMNGIGRYQQRGLSFRHWLLRIALNEINRHLHRASRRRSHERGSAMEKGDRESPHAAVVSERVDRIQCALLTLSTDHQTVIALHYFESLSVEDLARVLGCRPGTVKSRLSRARERLAVALADYSEDVQ